MDELQCPGCRQHLDVIAQSGRADDLYLCSQCYHSWFRFELADEDAVQLSSLHDWEEPNN